MRLMSWQAPQVSVKRCFIAPSGHSFAVYCACAGAANAIRISASSAHLVGGLPVSLIGMAVLPESDIFPLCFVVGDSLAQKDPKRYCAIKKLDRRRLTASVCGHEWRSADGTFDDACCFPGAR